MQRGGEKWIMAVYFPRGQRPFAKIKSKFKSDIAGALKNGACGVAFVTNQELTLSERQDLLDNTQVPCEIYHIERLIAILDQPSMERVRAQFLGIGNIENVAQSRSAATLYLQAIPLLANNDVQVRSGALEMLEQVGENSTVMRRNVISTLCRYLRNDSRRRDVDDAHILAQGIIARHITWPDRKHRQEPPPAFWEGMKIDLQEALLKNLDLSHAHVTSASFKNAEFIGDTWLSDSFIEEDVSFDGAQLNGDFYFSGSEIHGAASFSGASFRGASYFGRSVFTYDAHYIDCRFVKHASFVSCDFRGALSFHGSSFLCSADFTSLKVAWDAIFAHVDFKDTTFELAEFGDLVKFSDVRAPEEDLNLSGARVAVKLLTNIWPKGWQELPEGGGMASVVRIPEGHEREFIALQKKLRIKHMLDKDGQAGATADGYA